MARRARASRRELVALPSRPARSHSLRVSPAGRTSGPGIPRRPVQLVVEKFANAIDQATTFIQGTGHQMELEAIRSRTREALRSRVRAGRIAGGACYGFRLERHSDSAGRKYTTAVVNQAEAEVVRRMFADYLGGRGLKAIARALNREGVPSPSAGRRGTGSWSPGCIRMMLQNARYRGAYRHGRKKKLRRAGSVQRVNADPTEVLMIEIPEWRIVEEDVWFAVQERFVTQAPADGSIRRTPRAAKYPLTGIARCGVCGGAIGCTRTRRRGELVKAYVCTVSAVPTPHHMRATGT